jgi:hypothetical protein
MTMCVQYRCSDVRTRTRHNWYDIQQFTHETNADKCTHWQGELAHRLVKQLYGRTNKRDTTKQIGKRVRRLEQAQVATERLKIKTGMNDNIEINLDTRYQVSNARNDPVDIYAYVYANKGDPAFSVSVPPVALRDMNLMCHVNANRALFRT